VEAGLCRLIGVKEKGDTVMKNHFFRFTVLAMTCLAALSIGAADKPYVVTIQQGKISGEKLAASPSGDLTLTLSGGASQTFRAGSYRGAWIPKPPEVARLEEYAAKAQEDAILKEAPAVFNLYRFLGWGGRVSCLEGMAQYNRKQYAVALQTLDRGIGAKDDSATADLFRGKILVLLALKKNPDAAALTDKLVLATDERAAAFAFNTRGRQEERGCPAVSQNAVDLQTRRRGEEGAPGREAGAGGTA
jgi:hypothetical protein